MATLHVFKALAQKCTEGLLVSVLRENQGIEEWIFGQRGDVGFKRDGRFLSRHLLPSPPGLKIIGHLIPDVAGVDAS